MPEKHNRIGRMVRKVSKTLILCGVLVAALLGWEWGAMQGEQIRSAKLEQAPVRWGEEALASRPTDLWPTSIIPPANACGLGASSCFQCHNGFRASTPSSEAWHSQHEAVDNSCTGCHKGNPRILREDLAHRNMVADPRKQPADTCGSCHEAKDLDALVGKYLPGG